MKKTFLKYCLPAALLITGMTSCKKTFLDLEPQDTVTDVTFFSTPAGFKSYATNFYSQLMGWKSPYGGNDVYNHMDIGSDLYTYFNFTVDYGRGLVTVPTGSAYWSTPWSFIRRQNILLAQAEKYAGNKNDIAVSAGEAHFFRAYNYFELLKNYGGVPIVTTALDVKSPELYGARNSRYEVVKFILEDLDKAIAKLPSATTQAADDKGRVNKWGAEAFKARVLLYEGTWEKYVSNSTDGDGSTNGAGTAGYDAANATKYFTEAAALCKDVMENGGYELWNYNSRLGNASYYYLFSLEDGGSNPASLTKASNKEFILFSTYDYTYRQGGQNITHTTSQMQPSRKLMDMFLCTDGLPVNKSPLFQGYHTAADEFKNRDLRILGYVGTAPAAGSVILGGGSGYGNRKFAAYNYGTYRNATQESQDYSIIRLAEVYLTYAEALYEKNGSITDAQLNESINKIRTRAGVAPLTNALAAANGLDILNEIRRERGIELIQEGFRYDDLKRWGIAEASLNESLCGMVVGDASYTTDFRDALGNATAKYNKNAYVWGEEAVSTGAGTLKCVVIDGKTNRKFARKHYLLPIPSDQILYNNKLLQNPGY